LRKNLSFGKTVDLFPGDRSVKMMDFELSIELPAQFSSETFGFAGGLKMTCIFGCADFFYYPASLRIRNHMNGFCHDFNLLGELL